MRATVVLRNKRNKNSKYLCIAVMLVLSATQLSISANEIPTLDRLYEQGQSPINSAYTLTQTDETSGDNIVNIPFYNEQTGQLENCYYKWEIKSTATSQPRLDNRTNQSSVNFIGHYYNLPPGTMGGAIGNLSNAQLGNVNGDFLKNTSRGWGGGAICNFGNANIKGITGDFIGNITPMVSSNGGAILNYLRSNIGNIEGNFIGNSGHAGGAICNYLFARIGDLTGNFISNTSQDIGGAIVNSSATIDNITGDFIGNKSNSSAGAIYNVDATIDKITGNFNNNSANVSGGAVYNINGAKFTTIKGDFIGNTAGTNGGAI